ncbi:hypothetical protein [Phytohabitans rumicis]|uniref:Uncharacterized protein n=1 Tax=Phytohabitans rumicis TaxID=1076125 RepID=A0A6V8L618_9ACTN|nr:hypothetical protein [Phytohabitans rumicis]GFJ91674.1 hypothetical protein Prum_053160 [Phytohabitans rumicis]
MSLIGVTGHVHLSEPTEGLIFRAVTAALRECADSPPHGITCLALGADQIFARAIVALGGTFEAVLPSHDYREQVVAAQDRDSFDALLAQASKVLVMPAHCSGRPAYVAASKYMLSRSAMLFAIWDGQPTRSVGDTAHVVSLAEASGLPVKVLWPAGAGRR